MRRTRLLVLPLALLAASCPRSPSGDGGFAQTIAALSGPGGYFDTDNLISNERSYLHAISDLRAVGVHGGAYLGVGPGQNFSYIAEIDPDVALIVDVRRDNVLQHLIYKALFEAAPTRLEYLALLTGREVPSNPSRWASEPLDSLLVQVDGLPATEGSAEAARHVVEAGIQGFGFALQSGDLATIERFHDEFIHNGLDLRFRSHGRAPQFYYPTLRDLLREVDREGLSVSYVASDERYQRVRRLELADRVIPIVGDLGAPGALAAAGAYLERMGLQVSAFYTSNVEFYLVREQTFGQFIDNLGDLPLDEGSVIIKSYFPGGFGGSHPLRVPGYYSTQVVQSAARLVAGWEEGRTSSYWQIVTENLAGAAPAR